MKNQYEIDYQQGYDKANEEWLDRIEKIRAEIERERSFQRMMDEYGIATGLRKALEIIDKYKESEEPNADSN